MTFQEMINDEKFQTILEDVLISFTARTQDVMKAMPELRARALILQESIKEAQND
jgi:hypothetical protein